jgi:phosphomannomutase / phosphoglucomutase
VARKKTALDAALARGGAGIEPRRLGITVALGIALALAIACIIQALGVSQERSSQARLGAAQSHLVELLSRHIHQRQAELKQALDDDEIRDALATPDAGGHERALARLRQRAPAVVDAEFYGAALSELVEADLTKFGYARANILAEARTNDGEARAQIHRSGDKTVLALAQAVEQGDRIIAYAYVLFPGDTIMSAFAENATSAGRMALRQGIFGGAVVAENSVSGVYNAEEQSVEVPRSILTVATQRADAFKLGEWLPFFDIDSPIALWVAATLLIMLAGLLLVVGRAMRPAPETRSGVNAVLDSLAGKLRDRGKGQEKIEPMLPVAAARVPRADVPKPVAKPEAPAQPVRGVAVDRSIFRAYDIRGVVGKTLTRDTARMIGLAVGSVVRERGLHEIVVARDGRHSGPELSAELIRGLRAAGCDVIDIGAAPTPVLYFATYHLNAGSGIAVTGSHNPPDYNGFKIMVGGETLAEDAITDLYTRIAEGRFAVGSGGLQTMDLLGEYAERITGDVQVERRLKVVVDCGNGIAGAIAPQVLEGVGCEVIPLYCDVDGDFPNHHPDPSDPNNLKDLIVSVKQFGADIGLAFDGDGDRLGVVTASGEVIYPDRLLMLFAMDVLNRNPGAAIIYDVKCTGHLQDVILRHGGSPMMWKTGHSLIKAKMKEEDAELAGEMSGHFFFRERWYGFDDGIYAAARLVEILGATERQPQELFDELPKGVSTPELKIAMEEGEHYAFINKFREASSFPGARVSTIDGVRADYPDGWGLVRCSNTTPSLVLRFDADSSAALSRIQDVFREQLLAREPGLKLPF